MSDSKIYLKKAIPYLSALVTGIIIFIIGIKIVNTGIFMKTLNYIPTRTCFITGRIFTLDFNDYQSIYGIYTRFPVCQYLARLIWILKPFVNLFLRFGSACIGIALGAYVYDSTKVLMSKK